ncbi:MAG: phage tail fiber protein [Pirellula sp.]
MAEMSNYLENALVNATLRNTSYTSPATVYVALYTTDPTDADTGTEISGNGYARQSVTFGAPSNGASTNSAAVEFPQATGSWGTIAYIGLRDASSGGNLLYHSPLDASKTISTGDVFRISAGNLSVTLS